MNARTARLSWAAVVRCGVLAIAVARASIAQTPGLYVIDPERSRIEIRLFRSGLLGGLGDNHVIVLGRFSGTAEGSTETAWTVAVRADTASLKVVDPGESESTRQKVQATMLGPTQLDAARFASIEVRSRSLQRDGDKSWRMLADVMLHGITRQVEFPLAWSQSGEQLRVQGKTKLLLRDFNIQPARVAMGTIRVRNDFELSYDITLRKKT